MMLAVVSKLIGSWQTQKLIGADVLTIAQGKPLKVIVVSARE